MTDIITLTGLVASSPRVITTSEGLAITSFRLASTQRRFDRTRDTWVDGETNWYTISSFRNLARNIATSVEKGQRVVVTGRLRIREWDTGEKTGISIEVDADTVGHDLTWGTSVFTRTTSASRTEATGTPESGWSPPPGADAQPPSGSEPTPSADPGVATDPPSSEESPDSSRREPAGLAVPF